jgi:hypothetical protein
MRRTCASLLAALDVHPGVARGPGGWRPDVASPTSYRFDGVTVVGLYTVGGDAVSTDSVHNEGGPVVVTADLELLFWGDFWLTAVNPSQADIVDAVTRILASPYLSGIAQYGFQQLNLRGSTVVQLPVPPAPQFSGDDVKNMVWNLIDNNVFPEPDDPGGRIIYMTFAPDGTRYDDSGARGAHGNADDTDVLVDVDHAWVAWSDYGDLDYIVDIFTHELVETMTEPEPSNQQAWVMNRSINGGNEIGDACNNTADRLDGLLVQAYWSEADKACVIPWHSFSALLNSSTDTLDSTTIASDSAPADTGPCKPPSPYTWYVKQHHQQVTFTATTQGLDPPVFAWTVGGQPVSGTGSVAVTVDADHPDKDGPHTARAPVTVRFEEAGQTLRLFNPADGSYSVAVTVTISDGRGAGSRRSTRALNNSAVFTGQEFVWEDQYYKDRDACYGYLRTIGRRAVVQALARHHPGGDPPWVEQLNPGIRIEDLPQIRELSNLAHYLQGSNPGLAGQINQLIGAYRTP